MPTEWEMWCHHCMTYQPAVRCSAIEWAWPDGRCPACGDPPCLDEYCDVGAPGGVQVRKEDPND